ncbi:SDR family NAD(P)-dependent oxidoreductase [Pseudactinotalea suaedae]|uniref:SDR family NAD(P)-dependent oxidoreductase n=1 Tax=Pseudactinotalea suaedae TaxID=1524924 RepID=UPI0012E0E036|nr:SDR family NAD(P)-dependent oxidoreductase [Pseudactinotalea suaedae]
MPHAQHPVGTGFTAFSTVEDVMAGVDLTGANVVITGGHSGLGLVTTRALSAAGASVTVAARDPKRAARAVLGIRRVEVERLDLLDPASIDAFTARYRRSGRPLHILVNNAGLPSAGGLQHDARGYESQLAVNHLGHFQLTLGLQPVLRAAGGARVVTTSSGAHRMSDILWDDPHFRTGRHHPDLAYSQSKTANVLFTVELDRRWSDGGIRAFAPHPGIVPATAFNGSAGDEARRAMGLIDDLGNPIIDPTRGVKTLEQGAATIVLAAASPLLAGIGGVYLNNGDVSPVDASTGPVDMTSPPADVAPHAIDPGSAHRLWELSEQLVGTPTLETYSLVV